MATWNLQLETQKTSDEAATLDLEHMEEHKETQKKKKNGGIIKKRILNVISSQNNLQ